MKSIQTHFYKAIFISFFAVILNFGLKIYLSKLIEKETLALFYTAIDIFSFSLLILIGFRSSMVVAYTKTKDDEKILNIFRYFILILMVIAWGAVIPYIKHKMNLDIHYWYLVFTILSMSLYAYLSNQLAMYRLFSLINRSSFLEPLFSIAWFLIAYYLAKTEGIHALFIMTVMSSLSLSLYIWIAKYQKQKEPFFKPVILDKEMKLFLKNALISTVEFGSGIMMIYLAVFFMMRYYSVDELGDFQVVTKPILMYMITLFVFPVFRFLLPELNKLIHDKAYDEIFALKRWFYKFSFIVSALFVIFILLWGFEGISFLFPATYQGAYLYLTHLSFFFVFIMLNAYQISFIKASGAFTTALLIRLSGIGFFIIAFYITRLFSENSVSVVFGLAIAYMGMFLSSWIWERAILKKLLKQV
ncbi:MAG: hypothetical protein K0U47_09845 [Epsilonproteobacteria bacterium]|nr:hypothetical protein [Campylobacterota bacterium]